MTLLLLNLSNELKLLRQGPWVLPLTTPSPSHIILGSWETSTTWEGVGTPQLYISTRSRCYVNLQYSCNNTKKKRRTSSRSKLFCSYKYLEKIVLQAYYIVSVKIHVITYSKSQTSQLNFIVVWPRYRLPTEKDKRIRIQYTRVSYLGLLINYNDTANLIYTWKRNDNDNSSNPINDSFAF